jgi:acetolactate synthase-1/2/3 large subunit
VGQPVDHSPHPRTTLHASGGGIGQALPMAIGAQIGAPAKTVVAMCGDGGLLVNIGEFATARQENTPIVVILFDDQVTEC